MAVRACDFQWKKCFHFGQLNARSLWNKFDLIKPLIQSIRVNLVSFSETWLNNNTDTNLIDIPGYVCYRLDCSWMENNSIEKGGGVCFYVKNDMCASGTELFQYNMSSKNIEILWLTINIPNCKKMIVGNIYCLHQGNVQSFSDTLDNILLEITRLNRQCAIFILVDMNINSKATNNPDTNILKWFEQRTGLKQIINETKRFSNNNSCIDLIFTNSACVLNQGTLDVNVSDHEMIFVTRNHVTKTKNPSSFQGRYYRNYNENLFIQQPNEMI